MSTVRQPGAKRKITIEQLALSTRSPLRKGASVYLKWLLTQDDLHDTLRTAIHAELRRRGVER